jgi:hypothetical protein
MIVECQATTCSVHSTIYGRRTRSACFSCNKLTPLTHCWGNLSLHCTHQDSLPSHVCTAGDGACHFLHIVVHTACGFTGWAPARVSQDSAIILCQTMQTTIQTHSLPQALGPYVGVLTHSCGAMLNLSTSSTNTQNPLYHPATPE